MADTIMDGSVKWRLTNLLLSTQKQALAAIARLAIPIGSIITFAANAKFPNGYLVCNGEEVSKYTYPELFEVIGNSYGTPQINTNFKLPNLTNKVILGDITAGAETENVLAPADTTEQNAIRMLTTSMVYLIKAQDVVSDDGLSTFIFGGGGTTALATHTTNGLMSFKDKINLDSNFHQTNTVYSIGERVQIPGQPNYIKLECVKAGQTAEIAPIEFGEPDIEYYKSNTRYEVGDIVKVYGQPNYLVLECIDSGTTGSTPPDFGNNGTNIFMYYTPNTNYNVGDVVRVEGYPSNLVLECIDSGTSGSTPPEDFDYTL